MKETGFVIKTDGNMAYVSVKRKSSCGDNCAMCKGVCKAPEIKALADNKIGAQVGDFVIVEAETKNVLKCAFLVYLSPVLLMMTAYILSISFAENKIIAAVVSVLAFLISGVIVKIFDKKLAPKTYIRKILDK